MSAISCIFRARRTHLTRTIGTDYCSLTQGKKWGTCTALTSPTEKYDGVTLQPLFLTKICASMRLVAKAICASVVTGNNRTTGSGVCADSLKVAATLPTQEIPSTACTPEQHATAWWLICNGIALDGLLQSPEPYRRCILNAYRRTVKRGTEPGGGA